MSGTSSSMLKIRPLPMLVQQGLAIHNLNRAAESRLGLSLVQYHVLTTLIDLPSCSPLELAQASGVHPSTLTQTLKILGRKALILVAQHPRDFRKKILLVTRKGMVARGEFAEGIGQVAERMSPEHRRWVS